MWRRPRLTVSSLSRNRDGSVGAGNRSSWLQEVFFVMVASIAKGCDMRSDQGLRPFDNSAHMRDTTMATPMEATATATGVT